MAKKELLKDRQGNIVYPITRSECIITSDNSDVASKNYVDKATAEIVNSSPEQLQIINTLGEKLADDENVANAVTKTVAEAKKALFIDMWNERCQYVKGEEYAHGKYNEETGYFELNGITDITYEEALRIYAVPDGKMTNNAEANKVVYHQIHNVRTVFPVSGSYWLYMPEAFTNCEEIEVIRFLTYYNQRMTIKKLDNTNKDVANLDKHIIQLHNCTKIFSSGYNPNLKKILGVYSEYLADISTIAASLTKLEQWYLRDIKHNITFLKYNEVFEMKCWQYMIENAANTIPITITVHPNVYAKLLGEGDYSDGNGTQEEWSALNDLAISKQILFSTN